MGNVCFAHEGNKIADSLAVFGGFVKRYCLFITTTRTVIPRALAML